MLIGFGISPSRVKVTGGAAFDADAEAFFTAASITDSTQKSAINQLVLDLKSYNIWTKMKALYPIVGGSASSHAVNLKTPGTYNLTFATGVTHSSNGMVGNGSTGYANTSLNPSSVLSLNSSHISYYSRSNVAENVYDMGAGTDPVAYLAFNSQNSLNTSRALVNDGTVDTVANTNSQGFYIANRTASNVKNFFKNNTKTINVSTASGNLVNLNLAIMALRTGVSSVSSFNTKQCAFASIGDGLTDTEASNFYTAVQAYQTTLSRNV